MGFINKPIPIKEEKIFEIPGEGTFSPAQITIDAENNVFMFDYLTDINDPHEQYFALFWKNICFKITMGYCYLDEKTIEWTLLSIKQADHKNEIIDEEEIKKNLREAFKTYGACGYEIHAPHAIPQPTLNVITDF